MQQHNLFHRLFLLTIVHIICFVFSSESLAQPIEVGPIPITKLRTGWGSDTFAIETNQPISNPANCLTPDLYASTAANTNGYKTFYSASLLAFSLGKPVNLVISDTACTSGRPQIIGVTLMP